MRKTLLFAACGALLALSACEPEPQSGTEAQAEPGSQFDLTASIQDIMAAEIDPAADYIWESVGTIVTADGVDERRPRTDEEWRQVRFRAVTLAEATNLLLMDGRRVAEEGKKLEDEGVPGILTAAEAEQAIAANPAAFAQFAHALHDVGKATLDAIDARDVDGMMKAGEEMDAVCEGCHLQFWYPDQVIPEFPDSF